MVTRTRESVGNFFAQQDKASLWDKILLSFQNQFDTYFEGRDYALQTHCFDRNDEAIDDIEVLFPNPWPFVRSRLPLISSMGVSN